MADSRRINTNICDEEKKLPEEERLPFHLVAVILSSEFWPALKEEKLELPEQIKETMDMFTRRYEKLKVRPKANNHSTDLMVFVITFNKVWFPFLRR